MSEIGARHVLSFVWIGAVALLAAASPPAIGKQASAKAQAGIAKSAHYSYAGHWKRRHRAHKVLPRFVQPGGYTRVYVPRSYRSYETELLIDCLMSQPFVTCP